MNLASIVKESAERVPRSPAVRLDESELSYAELDELYEHPKIREAAVLGVPHERWGEEIGAVVVLHDGEELTAAQCGEYVKERIAAYKYPRLVWFLDDLPKGPTGKILKREIDPPAAA